MLSIAIAYLFLACGPLAAGFFALGQGLLLDLLSGGLEGISTAAYLAVFGTVYLGCRFFDLEEFKGQFIIVSSAVLLKESLFLLLLSFFAKNVVIPNGYVLAMLVSSVIAGLVTPFGFYILGRIGFALSRDKTRKSADAV